MTYTQAIQFLYNLRLFGLKLGLENTIKLAALAGNPEKRLRFIHVAGTNGKGSTCAMLESIYRTAGLRVGLFTSPHLVSFRERIQVNRRLISEADVVRLVSELRGLSSAVFQPDTRSTGFQPDGGTAGFQPASSVGVYARSPTTGGTDAAPARPQDPSATHPTFFEFVTVMALRYFAEQKCDLVIWETGMGGRLDATNIVTPLASVITNVQFDHQKWLGHTLTEIAAEKAGIIKPGVPVITATDATEALEVIINTARERKSPLKVVAAQMPAPHLPMNLPLSRPSGTLSPSEGGTCLAGEGHRAAMSPPASERAEPIASHVYARHTLRPSYGVRTAQRAVPTTTVRHVPEGERDGVTGPLSDSRAQGAVKVRGGLSEEERGCASAPDGSLPSSEAVGGELPVGLILPLLGEHQRLNAAVAIATVQALCDKIAVSDAIIRSGLERVDWPGRLQIVKPNPGRIILLDGAHNASGAEALREALGSETIQASISVGPAAGHAIREFHRQDAGRGLMHSLILGVLEDKDWQQMFEALAPLAQRILVVPVQSERTALPEMLRAACVQANPEAQVIACRSLADALKETARDPFVLITGSLYLVGEAMELLGLSPPAADERGLNEWTLKK